MKVYVVMAQSGYEDIWVAAVYSSKAVAEAFIRKEEELYPSKMSGVSMEVETYEVEEEV